MLKLRTFGGLSIESAASIAGATANRRLLALLALLAVSGRRGLSRDKIVALLGTESDAEHGRNSLSQLISSLRRELAVDDTVLGSTELRVNTDVLSCDVIEFEQRVGADDLRAATALYTGPFLDGVFLKNALEFERWVDQERSRLQHMQADALEQLALRAGAAGDHVSAARWWRQRAGLAPSDSRTALKLMESLVASGDPAGALAHQRVHQVLLREEGLEPDATHAEFAAALRTGGTLSAAASTHVPPNIVASSDFRDGAGAEPLPNGSLRGEPAKIAGHNVVASRRARWIAAGVVVLALITGALGLRTKRTGEMSQVSLLLADGLESHSTGAALSPDGKTVVYAAVAEGSTESPPRL